jgi:hypothetical protein
LTWIYFLWPLPGLDEILYGPGHDGIAASLAQLPLLILASTFIHDVIARVADERYRVGVSEADMRAAMEA